MGKKTNRREFIKQSSTAAAGLAAAGLIQAGCSSNKEQKTREDYLPVKTEWLPATCRICPASCGMLVRRVDGYLEKIEGNPIHPVNNGKLCVRGQGVLKQLLNVNRVMDVASKRTAGNGLPTKPVKNILSDIRTLMKRPAVSIALINDGRDSLRSRLYSSIFSKYKNFRCYSQDTYAQLMSGDNYNEHRLSQLGNCDFLLTLGDPVEGSPSRVFFQRQISEFRSTKNKHRGTLYHLSPHFSSISSKADKWIIINPGTEYYLLLGIIKYVTESKDLKSSGKEFEQLSNSNVKNNVKLPYIAKKTGISISIIKDIANHLIKSEYPLIYFDDMITYSPDDISIKKLISDFLASLHKFKGIENKNYPDIFSGNRDFLYSIESPKKLPLSMFFTELKKGNIPDLLFITGGDPFYNSPETELNSHLISRIKKIVSISSTDTISSTFADLVIPDLHFLEKNDLSVDLSPGRQLILNINTPVEDRHVRKIKDPLNIIGDLAGEKVPDIKSEITERIEIFFNRFKADIKLKKRDFIEQLSNKGAWWIDLKKRENKTEAQKVAVSKNLSLPENSTPYEKLTPEYPFVLFPFRTLGFEEGMSVNQPWIRQIFSPRFQAGWEFWAEIDESRASRYGLKNDDVIWIENRAGKRIKAKLKVSNMIHPDLIAVPLGFGKGNLHKLNSNPGYSALTLLSGETDADGRYIHMSETVKIYKSMES